jgi:hypothetical protein
LIVVEDNSMRLRSVAVMVALSGLIEMVKMNGRKEVVRMRLKIA